MKTAEEIKKLNRKDFEKELAKARKALMKLRFEAKTGQLTAAHKLHAAKNYVALLLTVKNMNKEEVKKAA